MNYFVDTNVFLRFLVEEDQQTHQECADFLKLVKEQKLKVYTSNIVLAEIAWTLNSFYDLPKKKRVKALRAIAGLRNIKFLDEFDPLLAIDLFAENKIKFIDALIASTLKDKDNWIIISYDDDFDKVGLTRKRPSEVK